MADSPGGGTLGAGASAGRSPGAAPDAESPDSAVVGHTAGGGVGDSPVRGELLPAAASVARTSSDAKVLRTIDDRIRKRADDIVSTGLRAPSYDLTGPKPPGVSARKWRIMQAAEKNMKSQPGWYGQALRLKESYAKADAVKPIAPTLNSPLIQINVKEMHVYARRKVED